MLQEDLHADVVDISMQILLYFLLSLAFYELYVYTDNGLKHAEILLSSVQPPRLSIPT